MGMIGNVRRLGNVAQGAGHNIRRAGHGMGRAGHWGMWGGRQAANMARGGGQNALHTVGRLGRGLARRGVAATAGLATGPVGGYVANKLFDRRVLLFILLAFFAFIYIMF